MARGYSWIQIRHCRTLRRSISWVFFLKVEACCKVTTRGAVSKLFMLEGVMFLRCWCFVGRVWDLQSRRWYEWWKAKEGLDDATLSREKMYDRRLFVVSMMSMMINCCAGWLGRNPTDFRLSYHDLWWGCEKDALSFRVIEKSFIFFWYQSSLIPKLSWFIISYFHKGINIHYRSCFSNYLVAI